MNTLLVFDFDGTLYSGDSMLDFARFLDRKRYLKSLVRIAIPLAFSRVGIVSRTKVKHQFLRFNLQGYSKSELLQQGREFFLKNESKIFPEAREFLKQHSEETTECLILSGSSAEWLQPFAEMWNAELLCTQLHYDATGSCSGLLPNQNIVGEAKVEALEKFIAARGIDSHIIAFGNTKSDQALRAICTEYHHKKFGSC